VDPSYANMIVQREFNEKENQRKAEEAKKQQEKEE
jgi:hypothetical protein